MAVARAWRPVLVLVVGAVLGALWAGPALACGGLVGPGGTVKLARTTTLAAWHDGVEHYVTSFEYAGGGAKFGSIVPLPGVPAKVEKGGEWTLQRLINETQPQPAFAAAEDAVARQSAGAEVLLEAKVDALDVTVLRGGGAQVGTWAREHGFGLTPDAPEVLDFYADRSPIFMAASFDPTRVKSRGQQLGQGTPVHLTIPTANPWVPLRILGLGLGAGEQVKADVYLLTDRKPSLLQPAGVRLARSEPASANLLADLRSDKGMGWLPGQGMWLSWLQVDTAAGGLRRDLAIDATGAGHPSALAAGIQLPGQQAPPLGGIATPWPLLAALVAVAVTVNAVAGRRLRSWAAGQDR
jgi:hypothetical protein